MIGFISSEDFHLTAADVPIDLDANLGKKYIFFKVVISSLIWKAKVPCKKVLVSVIC